MRVVIGFLPNGDIAGWQARHVSVPTYFNSIFHFASGAGQGRLFRRALQESELHFGR